MITVLIASLVAVALMMVGLGIKIIVKKHGEFKRHCTSMDPYTGERGGCVCGKLADQTTKGNKTAKSCSHQRPYNPLDVNDQLLDELR